MIKVFLTLLVVLLSSACKPGDTAIKAPTEGSKTWLVTVQAQGGEVAYQIGISGDGEAVVNNGGGVLLADGASISVSLKGESLEEVFVEIVGGSTGDLVASFSEILEDGTTERRDVTLLVADYPTIWRHYFFDSDLGGWL